MAAGTSPLSPFRHRAFAVIWTATLVSNIGVWMQSAAGGWLMTALAPEPRMVALVQVASALPMFLLGLPAGALADLFDRRRLLLAMEIVGTALTAGFAILVAQGLVTPAVLLAFVFLTSAAAAAIAPAWQAIVPQLVEKREDLAPAVALDSVSVNISRAIGPALAGVLIGSWGMAVPFAAYVVLNLACILALYRWHPAGRPVGDLPPEQFGNAILVGLRHARYNRPLRATLVRACGFFLFASAYWALLPLVASRQLAAGPAIYGLLLGAIGIGAIAGTVALPRLKAWLGVDRIVAVGTAGTAVAMVLFALARQAPLALIAGALAGASWIAVLATLNVSAQMSLPGWVRGRGLATYATVMFGAMTVGSLAWGEFASLYGLPAAHFGAAAGVLLTVPLLRRYRLQAGVGADLTPSMYWPQQVVARDIDGDQGPVLVTVEYRISVDDRSGFIAAIQRQGVARRRNGAYRWGIFEDAAVSGRWMETFVVDSWLEYLRQLKRVSHADRVLNEAVLQYQQGDPPVVTYFIAP
ncbi:MFS transporter [Castellaniella sp. MT123]|uniref:MFS transporter n=1 Tax=Castellaniella sp. MT123 TaxID=3140381 RepID=UPI0031F477E2